jgi:ferric-dicitrate binding protein FerR (iron transport regulator)
MSHHDYDFLWEKYYNGETSREEEQQLESSLQGDTDNTRLPEQQLFLLMGDNRKRTLAPVFDETLMNLIQKEPVIKTRYLNITTMFKCAASLLILSLVVYGLFRYTSPHNKISTDKVAAHFQLPDGSSVWLNKNSTLTFANDFEVNRSVELFGEGFFKVQYDPSNPFVIKTGNTQTRVQGTSFNVRSYEAETSVEVTVVDGKVSFDFQKNKEGHQIVLQKNKKATYDKVRQIADTTEVTDQNFVAWKTKSLKFDNAPLSKVISDLDRYAEEEINIENEAVLNCHYTGSFQNEEIEEIISAITYSLDLQIRKTEDGYMLTGPGCTTN